MQRNLRISFIVGFAIAILVILVPGNFIPSAYAGGHHHHTHHHSQRGHHHGHLFIHNHSNININQRVNQNNACDRSICTNSGSNDAFLGTDNSGDGDQHGSSSIIVGQSNNQNNACDRSICTNSGSNDAFR